ncbi:integral membrane protein S linking to the trans Golgi network-domain-containing protein [Flagelloscypha sp. PMI_526]|nr:integral membrane protein S linking to the trans Golgi network-domain-containing protein [Flagelloscypha sp. PMI_526]
MARSSSKPSTSNSTWDPVLIISQIVSLQAIHYLALSLLVPPLLATFANREELEYEGGPSNVAMIMDWRELAARPTTPSSFNSYEKLAQWVWSGGRKWSFSNGQDVYVDGVDDIRSWILGFCWLVGALADVFALYHIVSHPRLILDFTLTLHFIHLILTTYYSSSFPTSLYYWLTIGAACIGTLILAEWLCVRREMTVGLKVEVERDREEELEMAGLMRDREGED